MAQPLPNTYAEEAVTNAAVNGIDASAARLEQAFRRLEAAATHSGSVYASLKADHEKLNGLLRKSESDVTAMREAVKHVNAKLDATIATLESLQS